MVTYKDLYDKIWEFDNLLLALKKAQKGKRHVRAVAQFLFQQERNLFRLQRALQKKTYKPGKYKAFYIYDPKERMISAAPFHDRVIHHALCNVIEPLFEKTFIYDSYANRKGKGTHKAILRYQKFARKYPYVLKCDIRKFFPSIDHEILKQKFRWKIQCKDMLWLMDAIIDGSNKQEDHIVHFPGDDLFTPYERSRGLPIGNLTSQFWANVYMNNFDHFVKEELGVKGYIRYVDDFVIFGQTKQQLRAWRMEIENKLAQLRLIVHQNKTQIYPVEKGVPFLGFQVFPHYKYVRKANAKRHFRFLKKKLIDPKLDPDSLENSINSWLGHIRFGQSERREHTVFWYLKEQGVNLVKHPSGSWRVLEQ